MSVYFMNNSGNVDYSRVEVAGDVGFARRKGKDADI